MAELTQEQNQQLLELINQLNKTSKTSNVDSSDGIINSINRLNSRIDRLSNEKDTGYMVRALNFLSGSNGVGSMIRSLENERTLLLELLKVQRENNNFAKDTLQKLAGNRTLSTKEIEFAETFRKNMLDVTLQLNKLKEDEAKSKVLRKKYQEEHNSALLKAERENLKVIKEAIKEAKTQLRTVKRTAKNEATGTEKIFVKNYLNGGLQEDIDSLKKEEELKKEIKKTTEETTIAENEYGEAVARNNKQAEERLKSYQALKDFTLGIWHSFEKGATVWMDYNQQAIADSKRLGITSAAAANAYNRNLMAGSKELMRNFGLTREEATKMQETFQSVTGRAIIFNQQQMGDIAAASQLMGKENVAAAIKSMDAMGSTSDRAVELMDSTYARAKNTGLDTAKTSEAFVKNMSLANKMTFKGGVDGISRMTVLSQKLKFNLESVAAVADKFSTIEGAIQGSAQLQMLGGSGAMYGGNPMQMMYEALNDGEALTKRLTKMWGDQATFNQKTGEAELSGYQLQIIKAQAQASGMNPDDAVNIAKNQGKIKAMEAATGIARKYGADSDTTSLLENKAQYNKETGQWEVTWDDANGNRKTQNVANLSQSEIDEIKGDNVLDPVQDIKENVRQIAATLVPMRNRIESFKGMYQTGKAQLINSPMEYANGVVNGAARGEGVPGWLLNGATDGGLGTGLLWGGLAGFGAFGGVKGIIGGIRRFKNWRAAKNIAESTKTISNAEKIAVESGEIEKMSEVAANSTRAAEVAKAGKSMKTLKTLAKARNFARIGGKIAGPLAMVADVGFAALDYYNADQEREAAGLGIDSRGNAINVATGRQRQYNSRELEYQRNHADNVGAVAGAALGFALGGPLGMAIGSMAGGWLGDKIGGGIAGINKKDEGVIGKELEEINGNDADDNVKKIVLPVESIDYNVSLIANQLGIMSAQPARGYVYLDAEAAGEIQVQGQPLQASSVNQVDNAGYYSAPTYATGGTVTLNITGAIDLNMKGQNGGKLTAKDFKDLLQHNPQLQRDLAAIITGRQVTNGNAGRSNNENAANRIGTTSGTGLGGI